MLLSDTNECGWKMDGEGEGKRGGKGGRGEGGMGGATLDLLVIIS